MSWFCKSFIKFCNKSFIKFCKSFIDLIKLVSTRICSLARVRVELESLIDSSEKICWVSHICQATCQQWKALPVFWTIQRKFRCHLARKMHLRLACLDRTRMKLLNAFSIVHKPHLWLGRGSHQMYWPSSPRPTLCIPQTYPKIQIYGDA